MINLNNKIKLLDCSTINKIAAGEVVERPAAVVKELVENSLDACAKRIIVEIVNSGKDYIRITDDGHGIDPQDAESAFLRHATSKISRVEDLENIHSLGFRGEALASIVAVSRLDIVTKTAYCQTGLKLSYEFGRLISREEVATSEGTTIIVKDIFQNVPARKKFLKSDRAELVSITEIIDRIAVGHPAVKFEYTSNGKRMLMTPGDGNTLSAIRAVQGKDVMASLIELDRECEGCRVSGYVSNNSAYRSSRSCQYFYVNGRSVRSSLLSECIQSAYKELLPIGKHAMCFINIDIRPDMVDVNIHPTKLEVKFTNEAELSECIREGIIGALKGEELIPEYKISKSALDGCDGSLHVVTEEAIDIASYVESMNTTDIFLSNAAYRPPTENIGDMAIVNETENYLNPCEVEIVRELPPLTAEAVKANDAACKIAPSSKDAEDGRKSSKAITDLMPIGVFLKTYIVAQRGTSLFLIDQHAAHERILYEKYMEQFETHAISSQILMEPIIMEFSSSDMLLLEENMERLEGFGFEAEAFGSNAVIIRAVPNMFGKPESERFAIELIESLGDIDSSYELRKAEIAQAACKAAVKANDRLSEIAVAKLLDELSQCENPYTCPHGRPVIVEISQNEIEKMFKRII